MKIVYAVAALLIGFSPAMAAADFHNIENFHEVIPGVYRGARPTMADLDTLKRDGFRTIINIEDDKDAIKKEKTYAEKLGFHFYNYKMNAGKKPVTADVDAVLAILADTNLHPVFLHCKHGRDRTGMIFGIYRVEQNGWTPKAAYREMKDLGFRTFFLRLTNYFKKRTGYSIIDSIDIEDGTADSDSSELLLNR